MVLIESNEENISLYFYYIKHPTKYNCYLWRGAN